MRFLFPIWICICEIILHVSTAGAYTVPSFLLTVLFSFGYGFLLELIRSLFPKEKGQRRATTTLLALTAVLYLVAYFIYLEFKIFYDLNTVFFGAAGAVTDFGSEIVRMLLSAEGMLRLFLYFAPLIAYRIWCRRRMKQNISTANLYTAPLRAALIVSALFCFMTGISVVRAFPVLRAVYADAYHYTDTVKEYGLLTALRRDLIVLVRGSGKESAFLLAEDTDNEETDNEDADNEDAGSTGDSATTALSGEDVPESTEGRDGENVPEEADGEEIIYAPNAFDIDFAALSESSSGIYAQIDAYVDTLSPTMQNAYTGRFQGKNLIIVVAEAFSGYLIDEELTPTLYRMHTKGICFNQFYQPSGAGTTGGEYNVLLGLLPMAGGTSMQYKVDDHNYMTIASSLDREGYYGKMYHNGTWSFYDRHKSHVTLGYSDGYLGIGNGFEKLITEGSIYSDFAMMRDTFPLYKDKQPFNIYYMTISAHAPYSWGGNYFSALHKERVSELPYSEGVKAFIASNLDLEDGLTFLINALEEEGIADDTVIVVCADHFPYGLSDSELSELYGAPVTDSLFRDSNTLLIWCGELEKEESIVIDDPVVSLDILPTLLNLFGVPYDSRLLPGRDVFSDSEPLAFDMGYNWATPLGVYISSRGTFRAAEGVEETDIPEGYVEAHRTIVANKISFCRNLTYNDYYYHVFGDSPPGEETP